MGSVTRCRLAKMAMVSSVVNSLSCDQSALEGQLRVRFHFSFPPPFYGRERK